MALEEWRQQFGYEWLAQDFRERLGDEQRDQPRHELRVLRGLDDHGELHRGLAHLDRHARVGELRAVNDVGPVDDVGQRLGIEAELLLRDGRDELGARLEIGIVELLLALVGTELRGILWREERTQVVVEPPGDLVRAGVLEVDDGVLVAVELALVKQRTGAMDEAAELEGDVFADAVAIEAREDGGRARAVETLIVEEDPDLQCAPFPVRGGYEDKAG